MSTATLSATEEKKDLFQQEVEGHPRQETFHGHHYALIQIYLPLVKQLAWEVHQKVSLCISHEDLVSVGVHALANALEDFSHAEEEDFEEYCTPRIKDSLIDAIRYADWVSRHSCY